MLTGKHGADISTGQSCWVAYHVLTGKHGADISSGQRCWVAYHVLTGKHKADISSGQRCWVAYISCVDRKAQSWYQHWPEVLGCLSCVDRKAWSSGPVQLLTLLQCFLSVSLSEDKHWAIDPKHWPLESIVMQIWTLFWPDPHPTFWNVRPGSRFDRCFCAACKTNYYFNKIKLILFDKTY